MKQDDIKVEVINTIDALNGLEIEWKKLESELLYISPYQTWDWLTAWVKIKRIERYLYVLAIRDCSGILIGVAPFQKVSVFPGIFVLTFIGQDTSISQDFLLKSGNEEEILQVVFDFVNNKRFTLGVY